MDNIITENKTGCYIATNKLNKKVYIGQSLDCPKRRGEHENFDGSAKLFHKAIKKNGVENFDWEFIPVKEEDLDEMEISLIAEYKSNVCRYGPDYGYNMTDGGGGNRGYKFSEESKERMRQAQLGKTLSEEHKKKISEACKGGKGYLCSDESKEKMRLAKLGTVHSDETKKKMSESAKGRKNSDEHNKNISLAHAGKILSEDHKKKMSDAHKGERNWSWKGGADRICPRCKTNKVGTLKKSGKRKGYCDDCQNKQQREYYLKKKG